MPTLVDAQFASITLPPAQTVMPVVDVAAVAVDVVDAVASVTVADVVVDVADAVASVTVVDAVDVAAVVVAAPTVAASATSLARSRPSKCRAAWDDAHNCRTGLRAPLRYFDMLACGSLALWVVRSRLILPHGSCGL